MCSALIEAIEAADITSLRELSEQKEEADKRLNLMRHEPNPLHEAKNKEMNLLKHKQDQLKYLELYREKARKHQQAIEQGRQALVNVGECAVFRARWTWGRGWLMSVVTHPGRGRDTGFGAGQDRARATGRRAELDPGRSGPDE